MLAPTRTPPTPAPIPRRAHPEHDNHSPAPSSSLSSSPVALGPPMPGLRRRRAPPRLVLAPGLSSHVPLAMAGAPPAGFGQFDSSPSTLEGEDATLALAVKAYASGPVEILPRLYLSGEQTAHEPAVLAKYHITTILTVATECTFPPLSNQSNGNNVVHSPKEPRSPPHIHGALRQATSTPNLRQSWHAPTTCDGNPLPLDTRTTTLPPDPTSNRPWKVQCVLLPWAHDQPDLAAPQGGFHAACGVIASGLGISVDAHGRLAGPITSPTTESNESSEHKEEDPTKPRRPSVLVHCQCGISRSATAVIAYVMQSAALGHHPELLSSVRGMHDAYSRVKDLSPAISPNCSLLYQLVEWERRLTALTTQSEPHREEGNNISTFPAPEQERSETKSTLSVDSPASKPPTPNTGNLAGPSQQAPSPPTALPSPSALSLRTRPTRPTGKTTRLPAVPRQDLSTSSTTACAPHVPPKQLHSSITSNASGRPLAPPPRALRSSHRLPPRPTLRVSAPDSATSPSILDLPSSAGPGSSGTPLSPFHTTFGHPIPSPRSPGSSRTPRTPTSSRSAQSAQSTQSSVSHRLSLSTSESLGSLALEDENVPSSSQKFGTSVSSPSLRRQLHRRTFSADVTLPTSPSSSSST